MEITHVILNLDGTLLDTEGIYHEVTSEILARCNKNLTTELKILLLGLRQHESAELIIKYTGINMTIEDLVDERNAKNSKRFHEAKPMPGALVATSSSRKNLSEKFKNNEIMKKLIEYFTCGDDSDIVNGKPSPDLFLSSWKKLGFPAKENILVFEDALVGIEAAQRAGMNSILVQTPEVIANFQDNQKIGGVVTLTSLEFFEPEKYGVPAYD